MENTTSNHEPLLSVADQERFVRALLNPPPPNEAMQRAAERHRRLIESS